MRTFFALTFCALVGQIFCSDVLDLSQGDFQSSIAPYDTILVEFFAPWCGHCKRLAPEYESAASRLKSNDPPIPLAKVDCTTDEGKDICSTYGVNGYPTLKIFKNGEFSTEYSGPRQADGIVKYMKSKVGPSSRLFADKSQLASAIEKASDVLVLGIFEKDGASDLQSSFLKAADKLRESVSFGHVFSNDVSDVYEVARLAALDEQIRANSNNVLVIRSKNSINKFEPSVVAYSGNGDLTEFVKDNYHGLVGQRTQDNNADFKAPLVIVYYDVDYVKNPKGTNYWRNRVLKVAQNYKDINFAVSNGNQFAGELEEFGLEPPRDRDATPVVAARGEDGQKYKFEGKFSIETLEQFVKDLKDGKLESFVKSEPVPDNESADVKVAVAKNIQDLVIKADKDTLIEFYAPWCGHCKNLAPTYEELGKKLKDEPSVQIVKMDATANDVPPDFVVHGFPTIYWYPKNSKVPKKYEGGRDLNNFVEYIAKHATEELAGFDRSGNPKKVEL